MRYCRRYFTAPAIELMRELIAWSPPLSRYRLSHEVCARLNWRRADGTLKDMSCRVAMLRMQAYAPAQLAPHRQQRALPHPAVESLS